jgi:hypothetical protein
MEGRAPWNPIPRTRAGPFFLVVLLVYSLSVPTSSKRRSEEESRSIQGSRHPGSLIIIALLSMCPVPCAHHEPTAEP